MLQSYFVRGLMVGLVFGVPAGAIGALTIRRTLSRGFWAGLLTGLGSSAADVLYACIGVFGLTMVSDLLLAHQGVIGLVGGGIIVLLGIAVFIKKGSSTQIADKGGTLIACFASSFAIALANPATILSFLAAFATFGIGNGLTTVQGTQLIGGILLGTGCWWGAVSGITAILRSRVTHTMLEVLHFILGSLMVLFGLFMMLRSLMPPSDTAASIPKAPPASISQSSEAPSSATLPPEEKLHILYPTAETAVLADGLSMASYTEDYGFDDFLRAGGASSDAEVVEFLIQNGMVGVEGLSLRTGGFGCSTLSVKSPTGNMLFGRNFDWQPCSALVVSAKPPNGYASVSTVNMDFLGGYSDLLPQSARTLAALYAPLDGINEKGLVAAVLMIADADTINQNTEKPDITTTTAIRLLLDKAATVDEAVTLLREYDLHSSMNLMVHFAIADATGNSVVVEYVDNEAVVIETAVATNFYLAKGDKKDIGTEQSHTRYDILMNRLAETPTMDEAQVRDAMKSVSKQNFGEFETTEWSIVYDQSRGLAHYYHRENYEQSYSFSVQSN